MAFPPVNPVIFKDPSAVLEYGFDLSPSPAQLVKPWLAPSEAVTSLTVTADSGITVNAYSFITNSSGVPASLLVAWLSGGVAGTTYNVKFMFSTNQGRTDTRSMQVSVVQR
jgi:hypothetical protein